MSDYMEVEARTIEAVEYKMDHPTSSFRWLAQQFNVNKDRIHRRWTGLHESKSTRDPANLKMDKYQDKALCWYLTQLWEIGVPLRYSHIIAAANEVLAAANPEQPLKVSDRWPPRWLERHPEFTKRKEKSIELERQKAMNVDQIRDFMNKFKSVVDKYGIGPEDTWNMDETGLRVGCGKGQWVIVPSGEEYGRFTNLIGAHGDTEHITVVEAISAGGVDIQPMIIVKGVVIQARWFAEIKASDIAIGVSESGYTNDILCFQWLMHWNRLSKASQKGTWRLLILDGYESHLSFEFVRYCEMEKIVLLRLPPHSTHFLQPLDVVIFQQWKHWHMEAIDDAVRHGVGEFDRQTFLANLQKIREATFKEGNKKSAFRKCGFWPFRPEVVLEQIQISSRILENQPSAQTGETEETEVSGAEEGLPDVWDTPKTHRALYQQVNAIQDMLRSSVEPPDTPTRQQNRDNVKKFTEHILATDIVQKQLTNYMWDSRVAQVQAERRKKAARTQIQKGGVVYSGDVDRTISGLDELSSAWEADLPQDTKIYLLSLRRSVLPQLILRTKKSRQEMDTAATNLQRRATRAKRKRANTEAKQ